MEVLGFYPAGVGGAGTCAGQGGNKPRAGLGQVGMGDGMPCHCYLG